MSDHYSGMLSLLCGAKFQNTPGKCAKCDEENLESAHGNPMRALSGIFRCKSCGNVESTTMHLAKSMFPVQKMPDGALPFYLDSITEKEESNDE